MRDELIERVILEAQHIYDTHETIRQTAKRFGYSKSTVHNDVSYRLKKVDKKLYEQTRDILKNNFDEKHIRGGQATKEKYASQSEM